MDMSNINKFKELLESLFDITVEEIKIIGQGHDSIAYLVNEDYVFKMKLSDDKKLSYTREKAILDFLNKYLDTDVRVPKIEYSYITDELAIMGYKKIDGKFLNPKMYEKLTDLEKDNLKRDIAAFLNDMHSLDYYELLEYKTDNKKIWYEEYEYLKNAFYDELSDDEKEYVENFFIRVNKNNLFSDKKCLCHNDFSCNHLLLDDNNKLVGIIDFGDAGINDLYNDFIYLLEDSEEEIGIFFGIDVVNLYGNIDINKAILYQNITELYYPIALIIYGLKNDNQKFISEGRMVLTDYMKNMKD